LEKPGKFDVFQVRVGMPVGRCMNGFRIRADTPVGRYMAGDLTDALPGGTPGDL